MALPRVVFSGVQPSGRLHLGNYLGAIRQWVAAYADAAPSPPLPSPLPGAPPPTAANIFCIVDLHALTQQPPPRELRARTLHMGAALLACGLAPRAAPAAAAAPNAAAPAPTILFPQSAVRAHAELGWLLACQTPLGRLQRMTQFKQKSGAARAAGGLGLLSYPVLQAADILLYRASHVPVGEDQQQHLELAREAAAGANAAWGAGLFPAPATLTLPLGARVMSLKDGAAKMSKSDPDDAARINMDDSDDAIAAKVRAARTDSAPGFDALDAAARPEKANLVALLAALTGRAAADVAREHARASAVAFKAELTDALVRTVAPVRGELARWMADLGAVEAVLRGGADAARERAEATMAIVRERAGTW